MPPEVVSWVPLVQRFAESRATRYSLFNQVGSLSAYQCVGTEQHAQLAHQTVGGVHAELVREAQDLLVAEVEEDLRVARMLAEDALQAIDERLVQARRGQLDPQRL